ncbi:MAG: hypothetical protein VB086_09335 [Clostridiaceae bacterium]|nr:hypothetical protein [Clostridiaceae bacterium]
MDKITIIWLVCMIMIFGLGFTLITKAIKKEKLKEQITKSRLDKLEKEVTYRKNQTNGR